MTLALICAGVLAVAPERPPATTTDLARDYQEARARAGRSPGEQVRLALWCEARGLTAERLNHLALAVLADPRNAAARGLMGLVAFDGRFQRPEAVAEKARADAALAATLAEYDAKRLKAPYTAEGQWALGLWCDEHGLKDQARAHFTAVTRLDPSREHAWQRLGYKKLAGRWITEAQAAAEKAEHAAQKLADKEWRPRLDRLKAMLDQPVRRAEAEEALAAITDPRAVPSIVAAFVDGRTADQLRAVQLLGQVDAPAASRSLAALAVFPRSAEVRRAAVETLRARDPRDFVRAWIALIRDPIKYQAKPVGGPGQPGTLTVEGPRANLRRVYAPPPMPSVPDVPGARLSYDANGLPVVTEPIGLAPIVGARVMLPTYAYDGPQLVNAVSRAAHGGNLQQILAQQAAAGRPAQRVVGSQPFVVTENGGFPVTIAPGPGGAARPLEQEREIQIPIGQMRLEAQRAAVAAQQQLAGDVEAIEKANAAARRANEPVLLALKAITGQELGDDAAAWGKWWTDQEGYAFHLTQTAERPTIIEPVPLAYNPTTVPQIVGGRVFGLPHHSCFGAGTMVRTLGGDRAIESVRAGDLVLSQDPRSGGLSYQPVLAAYHNPPSATLRVRLGEDSVVATGIHRFWKTGKGWTMARDLRPGDNVRTLGGVARVEAVDEEKVQPVFNLEVAEGHSFLVGKLGALVHDNSLVEPVPHPFDAVAVAVADPGGPVMGPVAPLKPAVFLDKDGTIIENVPYNVNPARIRLLPGAAQGLARLHRAGYPLVVISNQSGVARGYFPAEALAGVEARLRTLLAGSGVPLAGFYYCPHHPEGTVAGLAVACDCRKPAPGLVERAARELGIDRGRSWFVGDLLDDVEAGRRAGCRTVLIDHGRTAGRGLTPERNPDHRAADLAEAARRIVEADAP